MLVVTRKQSEKVVFPALGITVHILRSSGAARVGIDTPPDVNVLRDEITVSAALQSPRAADDRHALANALSKLTLAVNLARRRWSANLPAAADATLARALQTLESLDRDRATPRPAPRFTVLVVEDDPNERELLAGLLGMNGCACATAADGAAALEYLATHERPNVVLLDMAMPRCDGPETLRRIRANDRLAGLRGFSTSSTSPQELRVPDGPDGFDGWFPKPLDPRRLWAAIQSTVAV